MADHQLQFDILVNDNLNIALNKAIAATAHLERNLSLLGSAMGNNGGHMRVGAIAAGVAFGNAAYGIISRAAHLVTGFFADVMHQGLEHDKIKADYKVILGEASKEVYKQVQDFVVRTPFGNEIFGMVNRLAAAGIQSDKLIDRISKLADISGVDPERLASIVAAYSKAETTGKLRAGTITSFAPTGFNPLEYISKKTGLAGDELYKAMRKGALSVKFLDEAIDAATKPGGKFYNRIITASGTPFGKLEALKGNWDKFKQDLGQAILASDGFTEFLIKLDKAVNSSPEFIDKLTEFGSNIFKALGTVVDKIQNFTKNGGLDKAIHWITLIVDNFQTIAITLISLKLVSVIEGVVTALSGLATAAAGIAGSSGLVALLAPILPELLLTGGVIAAVAAIVSSMGAKPVPENYLPENQADFINKLSMTLRMEKGMGLKRTEDVAVLMQEQGLGDVIRDIQTRFPKVPIDQIMEKFTDTLPHAKLLAGYRTADQLKANENQFDANKKFYEYLDQLSSVIKPLTKKKDDKKGGGDAKIADIKVTGVQPKQIIVNIHDGLVNHMTNTFQTVQEGAEDIVDIITRALIDGIHGAELQQSNVPISN